MNFSAGGDWIIDDTAYRQKGKHSVVVGRQYCGVLGEQDNCQVAVSIWLDTERASLPVAYRLYLPRQWATDAKRREHASMPPEVKLATKGEIALTQPQQRLASGHPETVIWAMPAVGSTLPFGNA